MYDKERLEKMTVSELKVICKENGIPHYNGKNCFKKAELIVAILGAEKSVEKTESATDKCEIDNQDVDDANKSKKQASDVEVDMKQKVPYIEGAEVGTIVAFRMKNGKVKSAKIVKKSTRNRRFMLETNYGAQYIIPYDDIIWVRTSQRWPRGVYNLLKGQVDGVETEAN